MTDPAPDDRSASSDAPADAGRALVTGGAVRVGRATALALAREGWDVAVHCRQSTEEAAEVVRRVRSTGRSGVVVRADLRDVDALEAMVERAARQLGGLDLLVNNAAVFPAGRPAEVEPEAWDDVFAVNARAPFFCAVAARERMGPEGGSVVNLTDAATGRPRPGHAPYAATKAALESLTRSLAAAWAPSVRVNAVAPGPVLLPEEAGPEERRRAARSTALGRVGRPEDVARAVVYLAGADYVTGEIHRVDGGPPPPDR